MLLQEIYIFGWSRTSVFAFNVLSILIFKPMTGKITLRRPPPLSNVVFHLTYCSKSKLFLEQLWWYSDILFFLSSVKMKQKHLFCRWLCYTVKHVLKWYLGRTPLILDSLLLKWINEFIYTYLFQIKPIVSNDPEKNPQTFCLVWCEKLHDKKSNFSLRFSKPNSAVKEVHICMF